MAVLQSLSLGQWLQRQNTLYSDNWVVTSLIDPLVFFWAVKFCSCREYGSQSYIV